jgi:CubicO group peptidase (beta-lactamase class C family)
MKLQRNFLITLALLVCVFVPSALADHVDDYVREEMRLRHVPGLALAVVRDGKVIKESGYGLASVELDVAVTPETVFEIGSVSKQITAAAIMLLVEEGKLSLDDKISKHLPGTPGAWEQITVRNLLSHTSGLKNYTGLAGFELTERLKRDDFIKRIGTYPLAFAPGAAHSYGNTNYNLLGYIIEAVSGRPYWEFVRDRIFAPLGMSATHDRDPRYVLKHRANGYEWEDGALVGRDYDLTDVFSAGAIVSTVRDLVKWDAALGGERLLKRSSLAQIWTPTRLNDGKIHPYALGWYVETLRGHRRVRHNGQTAGFAASIARYDDDRLTVIVLCNLGSIGLAGRINQGIAKLYVPALSLASLASRPDPDAQTTRRLEALLRELLAGRISLEAFTPERLAAFSTPASKSNWQQLASNGPLKSLAFVESEPSSEKTRSLRYKAALGPHLLLVRFVLAEDGRVSELNIEEEE